MKYRIILSLLAVLPFALQAQDIIIDLSLEYRCETPYLNVRYINNTNVPLYFPKVCSSSNEMPRFACPMMFNPYPNEPSMVFSDYSGECYHVFIDGTNHFYSNSGALWLVLSDSIAYNENYSIDVINRDLENIYKDCSGDLPDGFLENKISMGRKEIIGKYNRYFIFLEEKGSLVDSYNLFGFQMLKGKYRFCLCDKTIKDFVYANPYWDETGGLPYVKYETLKYPKQVGDYILFSGEVKVNELEVVFD